ncbi:MULTISPECIES: M23 family metallopeptidase [unclassified Cryobacterium]|uniref:M23 family metallopeptidase n=1 Tax=unclassified Cryobacterium TaxID=2649013 RepID=UPI0018E065F2|nr:MULTISPECIES: M23 family metallopeptidase [unclassified Cryobacterium]
MPIRTFRLPTALRRKGPAPAPAATDTRARRPFRALPLAAAVAMLLAGLLTATLAIPAQASELDHASGLPNGVPPAVAIGPAQSLPASTATTDLIQRDGFSVTEAAAPAPVAAPAASAAAAPAPAAPAPVQPAIRWPFPSAVRLSDTFGPREAPCDGCSTFHKGLDMLPGEGAAVGAVADGVVRSASASDDGGLGVHVVIDHTVDGRLVSSVYAHFQAGSLQVSPGQSITVGQHLGNVGSTGQSTGPHLHFEILLDGVTPTDPYAWLMQYAGAM